MIRNDDDGGTLTWAADCSICKGYVRFRKVQWIREKKGINGAVPRGPSSFNLLLDGGFLATITWCDITGDAVQRRGAIPGMRRRGRMSTDVASWVSECGKHEAIVRINPVLGGIGIPRTNNPLK